MPLQGTDPLDQDPPREAASVRSVKGRLRTSNCLSVTGLRGSPFFRMPKESSPVQCLSLCLQCLELIKSSLSLSAFLSALKTHKSSRHRSTACTTSRFSSVLISLTLVVLDHRYPAITGDRRHHGDRLDQTTPHREPSVCSPSQTQSAKLHFGGHSRTSCFAVANLTNLSPLSPTLDPYSHHSLTSHSHGVPLSRTRSHTHTHLTQGPRSRGGFLMAERLQPVYEHGKCHACLANGSIFDIRRRYVYCLSTTIGPRPLHPSQQQGAPLCKSEPPFCSILVPASSKTLRYLRVFPVFAGFCSACSVAVEVRVGQESNFFEKSLVADHPTGSSLAVRATRILI
ncbi:hypothetical protein B0T20DRAFT_51972 [Sordaria brevicollis]|uniref:Uncharacterized protein n=1 Tax=Sordaria brevicollis TaxID=83679 RepID=A0AAE0P307_SORBR|nr:hypothetical protein B0T20DRAFT_51972 [Sordaria brevicollis]